MDILVNTLETLASICFMIGGLGGIIILSVKLNKAIYGGARK